MWKHWINVFLGILIGVGAFWLNFNLFWLFVLGALASLLASAAFEKKKDFWAWLQLISALLVLLAAIVGSIFGIGSAWIFLVLAVLIIISSLAEIG
jgi:hypothetical protein